MTLGALHLGTALPGTLHFGPTAGGSTLTLAATLPAPLPTVRLATHWARMVATLPAPLGDFAGLYAINVPRGPALSVASGYEAAIPHAVPTAAPWRASRSTPWTPALPWRRGSPAPFGATVGWTGTRQNPSPVALLWGEGAFAGAGVRGASVFPDRLPATRGLPWGAAGAVNHGLATTAAFPLPVPVVRALPWEDAERQAADWGVPWGRGATQRPVWRLPWGAARPAWCYWTRWLPTVVPTPRTLGHLSLRCLLPGHLSFSTRCWGTADRFPPIQRSYRVIQTAAVTRLSDGAEIPVSALSLTLDWESWSWAFSAALIGRDAVTLLGTLPVEVKVVLNGFEWRCLVEEVQYDRRFGAFAASMSGRSLAAWLSEPHSPTRTYQEPQTQTAEQLALQELPVSQGWSLLWQLPMWTVPANTWAYTNLTPLAAIQRLVQSAGGRLAADAAAKTLMATPKWPIAPWAWTAASPTLTVPMAYVTREARTAQPGLDPDTVLVTGGGGNGVIVQATITGQPGDVSAPTVVDTLITDVAPGQARAVQALADLWTVGRYQVTLPLQAIPQGAGLIVPGTVMDVEEGADGWRGLVTGTTLTASRTAIQQTLEAVGYG